MSQFFTINLSLSIYTYTYPTGSVCLKSPDENSVRVIHDHWYQLSHKTKSRSFGEHKAGKEEKVNLNKAENFSKNKNYLVTELGLFSYGYFSRKKVIF
jgi:hypothetical protein